MIRYADGGIEVRLDKDQDIRRLLEAKEISYRDRNRGFISIPVTVEPHPRKNSVRGVMTCAELGGIPDEEIADCLADQGVTEVKRIKKKVDGVLTDTNAFILTFSSAVRPEKIKVGFLKVSVRDYIPDPLRCFKCQRFGHVTDKCENQQRCAKCSSADGHDSRSCTSTQAKCTNCRGEHGAWDRKCPTFLREKEIQSIKVKGNLTYREARQTHSETNPVTSYRDVATRQTAPPTVGHTRRDAQQLAPRDMSSLLKISQVLKTCVWATSFALS